MSSQQPLFKFKIQFCASRASLGASSRGRNVEQKCRREYRPSQSGLAAAWQRGLVARGCGGPRRAVRCCATRGWYRTLTAYRKEVDRPPARPPRPKFTSHHPFIPPS